MNRIDKTVLLEIQTNLGYFEYKDNRTVGTYCTLNKPEPIIEFENYKVHKVSLFCLNCNKEFVKTCDGKHVFCSTKCRDHFNYIKRKYKKIITNK